MQIIQDLTRWRTLRAGISHDHSLGFVPTMGHLHDGHASLIERSHKDNDFTVVSLFVNPTQFNRSEDFNAYPSTLDQDIARLTALKVDYCLLPDTAEIYADNFRYTVQESELSQLMEGPERPGHFSGMLTVVLKLLLLIQAQHAYFGEKDYQQYRLIADMAKAFFLSTRICVCPTIRERDGLAFSSRNTRLNPQQRARASAFATTFLQPSHSLDELEKELRDLEIDLQYLCDYEGRRFVAVQIDDIRLIDNYALDVALDCSPPEF